MFAYLTFSFYKNIIVKSNFPDESKFVKFVWMSFTVLKDRNESILFV